MKVNEIRLGKKRYTQELFVKFVLEFNFELNNCTKIYRTFGNFKKFNSV